eukprot:6498587-Ditylum_brightwellii.AAC.1
MNNDAVIPLHGDIPLHMVCLPSAILVSYTHGLQSGNVSNKDLRYDIEVYHPFMGFGLTHWHINCPWQQTSQA